MTRSRRALTALAALGAIAALVWALWPAPVAVDIAEIRRGPMAVTVSANGVTRIRDTYLVTAPFSGTTTRSPVEIGDEVVEGETVVAAIEPAAPALLDARTRAQSEAAVTEARAALRHAEVNVERAQADVGYALSQHARFQQLVAQGTVARRMLDDVTLQLRTAETALDAAISDVERQRASLQRAEAQLLGPNGGLVPAGTACCVQVRAPAGGTVLSIENVSARLVQAGEPLLTIGRAEDLEIEVELLSSDAVRIRTGAEAWIARWGGPEELEARVRRIEPSAQTRVSALGIEEQRVRVRLDLVSPPEARPGLGDNYRVFVRVVEWAGEDVLQVPVSALFRQGEGWAVFRVEAGRAVPVPVEIGRRTALEAQVLDGLAPGEQVILYPGERITEGQRVTPRAVP